jgi:hypothetical protein
VSDYKIIYILLIIENTSGMPHLKIMKCLHEREIEMEI